MTSHHETLGVDATATPKEIKAAYRRLVKEHHPDVGGDEERFKAITAAYEALTNPQPQREEFDPFANGQWRRYEFNMGGDGRENMEEIFRRAAGFHPGYNQAPPRNRDLRIVVRVPLSSIVEEAKRVIQVNTGRNQKTVEITVPAGVYHGTTIRYNGYGSDAITQAPPGDLLVVISVEDEPNFYREENNVLTVAKIDSLDAILGGTVEVPGIRGNTLSVTIPAGIQFGQRLRVAGQGLPNPTSGSVGNMLVEIHIETTRNLDEAALKKLRSVRDGRIK